MPRGVSWWHLCSDALAVFAGFYLAHLLRFGLIPAPKGLIPLGDWMALAALSLPVWLFVGALHGLYYTRLKQSFAAETAVASISRSGRSSRTRTRVPVASSRSSLVADLPNPVEYQAAPSHTPLVHREAASTGGDPVTPPARS